MITAVTYLTDALALTLLHSVWQGAVIFLIIGILRNLPFWKHPDRLFTLYLTGLLGMTGAALATFLLVFEIPVVRESTTAFPTDIVGLTAYQGASGHIMPNWPAILVIAWAVGVLMFSVRIGLGWFSLRRLVSHTASSPMHWQRKLHALSKDLGIGVRVRLRTSTRIVVPFVFGTLRPVIVFPAVYYTQLTPAQLESILLHELAHIRRNDYLLNCIQLIIESLFFYHPVTWWLSRELREQRECACDDIVSRHLHHKKEYLEALYKIAKLSSQPHALTVALFNNQSELIMRVKRMLDIPQQKSHIGFGIPIVGLLFLAAIIFAGHIPGAIAQQPAQEPAEIQAEPVDVTTPDIATSINGAQTALKPESIVSAEQATLSTVVTEPVSIVNGKSTTEKPVIARQLDTIPTDKEMEKLRKQVEEKEREMEKLAEEMEKRMEEVASAEMAEIERLAEEMEELHEAEIEALENAPEFERLEELSEAIGERMEVLTENLESMLDEELMQSIEKQMEERAYEFERLDSVSPELREEFRQDMLEFRKQMEDATREYRMQHEELRNDELLQQLKQEMQDVRVQLEPMFEKQRSMSPEIQAMQEQLQQLHASMQEKMESVNSELRQQLEAKAQELRELHMQLEKAHREKHQKDNNR